MVWQLIDAWEIASDSTGEHDMHYVDSIKAICRASDAYMDARSETSNYSPPESQNTQSAEDLRLSDTPNPALSRISNIWTLTPAADCEIGSRGAKDVVPPPIDNRHPRDNDILFASGTMEGDRVAHSADLDYALIRFSKMVGSIT